jgi:ComF family protein
MWAAHDRCVLNELFDFISPPRCVLCNTGALWMCRSCQLALGAAPELVCPGCDRAVRSGVTCELCKKLGSPLDQLISAFPYESRSFHAALAAFKEDGCKEVASILSRRLALRCRESIKAVLGQDWLVVPVPASRERQMKHGFNQSAVIGERVARSLHIPISTTLLRKQKGKKKQKELNVLERRNALKNAFAVTGRAPANVVLVDDVATTLATLETCADQLKNAGARQVIGAVLAHA